MALRTAKVGNTVSYRNTKGETFNATVTGLQPATPTAPGISTQTSGGTLSTGLATSYRLVSVIKGARSLPSTAATVTTGAGSTNQVTLTWTPPAGADAMLVYGRTSGSELLMATLAGSSTGFIDTGAVVTPAGALPVAGEVGLLFPMKTGGQKVRSVKKATAPKQTDVYYSRVS